MRGIDLEGVLQTDRGAARIAQPLQVDPAHRAVERRGFRPVEEVEGLARQLVQLDTGSLDVRVGRSALCGRGVDDALGHP